MRSHSLGHGSFGLSDDEVEGDEEERERAVNGDRLASPVKVTAQLEDGPVLRPPERKRSSKV